MEAGGEVLDIDCRRLIALIHAGRKLVVDPILVLHNRLALSAFIGYEEGFGERRAPYTGLILLGECNPVEAGAQRGNVD